MGLVLRDTQVVDIAQANAAFENGNGSAAKLAAPADMKELIARYDAGWKDRLAAIARAVPAEGAAPHSPTRWIRGQSRCRRSGRR